MTDELFILRDLIHERTGLFFRDGDGIRILGERLGRRLEKNGCGSFSEYLSLLADEKNAEDEWIEIITELTRNKSPFVRHKRYVGVLANHVLPALLKDNETKQLKVWSAGCSTGEEPLMIAIALAESGWFDRARIEILASDGSRTAIEKARRGLYDAKKVELGFEPALRDKYFTPAGTDWQIRRELQARVEWSIVNLAAEYEIAPFASADVIFCRNVVIYFSDRAVAKTLGSFERYMPAGGYLFSDEGDHFERLAAKTGLFERQEQDGVSLWRKRAR